ncbi:anthranilate phosphoribosyltransferase [Corynebacterium sp. sy039]|uniref:anthranilate phosphoribosyltransferase n=1 Tax=Corynebacterium sp. sy039 TaxID=2599641 RepID=UPI0011B76791|nr:anthranilate phosphoribosyltransferase [Corynebacterium sp. sy039]QDZ43428.1 anthranilate phosphoribosyltransferase [Corynebacterium sp. sy039]
MTNQTMLKTLLDYLDNPQPTIAQAQAVFQPLTQGEYDDIHIAALLATLRTRGETFADIVGAARAFLDAARPFPVSGAGIIDTAGTGGDGANTINITTGASLVTAAAGCKVVKCGNRSVSSRSGSADVLEELGIRLDADSDQALKELEDSNFTFLFAPAYHPAVAHVMPVRRALKLPTIFNTLGPILSPVRPELQIMGIAKPAMGQLIAEVFRELGRKRALVIHGSGTDEIALHGTTLFWELHEDGDITHYELSPQDLGVASQPLSALVGGDAQENARLMRASFSGSGAIAHRDALAVNAGAMLYLHDKVDSLAQGTHCAQELLDSGAVAEWLESRQKYSVKDGHHE